MTNEHDRKLRDLELLRSNLATADDFNEVFEDLCHDKEFMRDPDRCSIMRKLMFEQGEFLGREAGKEALRMDGPGNN